MATLSKFKSIPLDGGNRIFFRILIPIVVFIIFGLSSANYAKASVNSWQKAVSFNPQAPGDFAGSAFRQSIINAQKLGANMATFIIPYYQTSYTSSDIQPGWNTPTDDSLKNAINFAHSLGMQVSLKIHMTPYYGNAWAAFIDPSDKAAWFENYGKVLNHYAEMAEQRRVEQICLGNELVKLSTNKDNTAYWTNLISSARGVYSGQLTYNANAGGDDFSNEKNKVVFWDQLDYIGISTYPGFPEISETAWQNWNNREILPLWQKYHKPILLTEVGFRSVKNAHTAPWYFNWGGEVDTVEQANDYQTLFAYWNRVPYMKGLNIWGWETNPSAGGPDDNQYTIQNKPAEKIVRYWFSLQ